MGFAHAHGYAGVKGANLQGRMEQIMSLNSSPRSPLVPRVAAGAAMALLMLLPLAGGRLRAQQQAEPPGGAELGATVERYLATGRDAEAISLLERRIEANP